MESFDYDRSNEQLTPYHDGDELIWITVTEYYRRHFGSVASKKEFQDGTEPKL